MHSYGSRLRSISSTSSYNCEQKIIKAILIKRIESGQPYTDNTPNFYIPFLVFFLVDDQQSTHTHPFLRCLTLHRTYDGFLCKQGKAIIPKYKKKMVWCRLWPLESWAWSVRISDGNQTIYLYIFYSLYNTQHTKYSPNWY